MVKFKNNIMKSYLQRMFTRVRCYSMLFLLFVLIFKCLVNHAMCEMCFMNKYDSDYYIEKIFSMDCYALQILQFNVSN